MEAREEAKRRGAEAAESMRQDAVVEILRPLFGFAQGEQTARPQDDNRRGKRCFRLVEIRRAGLETGESMGVAKISGACGHGDAAMLRPYEALGPSEGSRDGA